MGNPTVKDLDAWRSQAMEALGEDEGGFAFEPVPGGEVFRVAHPLMMTDEHRKEFEDAQGLLATVAVLLGGGDVYARFHAAGGRAGDVMMAFRVLNQGVKVDPNLSAFTRWYDVAPTHSSPTSSTAIPANTEPSINGGAPSLPAPAS